MGVREIKSGKPSMSLQKMSVQAETEDNATHGCCEDAKYPGDASEWHGVGAPPERNDGEFPEEWPWVRETHPKGPRPPCGGTHGDTKGGAAGSMWC